MFSLSGHPVLAVKMPTGIWLLCAEPVGCAKGADVAQQLCKDNQIDSMSARCRPWM
jgi:hypothetical protein